MKNIELNPKELLIAILHRWKMILVLGLVVMLLIGGLSYYQRSAEIEELRTRYNTEIDAYREVLAAKNTAITHHKAVAASMSKYLDESVLMEIDPYNKQVASITVSVGVDPDTLQFEVSGDSSLGLVDYGNTKVNKIISRYLVFLGQVKLNELFAGLISGEHAENYLRELVSVSSINDIITLSVVNSPALDAGAAVKRLLAYMEEKYPFISGAVFPHRLTVLDESTSDQVDTGLADFQMNQRSKAGEASSLIIQLQEEIDELRNSRPGLPSLASSTVRNSLFGLILGLLLGIVVAVVRYLSTFTLQYALQAKEQLDIGFLGGAAPRKGIFLTGLKNRVAGEQVLKPEAEALQVAGANIQLLAAGHDKVLLSGQLDEEELARAAAAIAGQMGSKEIQLLSGSDLGNSAHTVQLFSQADAVVLVERLQQSRLKRMLMDKERIEQSGKPLLGYILL